ncbi:S4 domain-containing protein, partial [Dietzia sp.]|uniref:S4 domain-containing protein n=1 Tax=Dietzia sp. TaxID=1871616 RepID=UPI002FD9227A
MSGNDSGATGRVDAWTWAVRLFPSRTQAAKACRAGHVKIDGESVPPSHKVAP